MTLVSSAHLEDVVSSLGVMRAQEETAYMVTDYLYSQQQQQQHSPLHLLVAANSPQCPVDAECRFKMAEWCFQVVDFCKFNRETVSIALSYLDRFLSTDVGRREALMDRRVFQLAAMTCLYTAVKIHEPEAMEPKTVAGLSRGAYTAEQVEAMERTILQALGWRMNPPTAAAFLHHFMQLVPTHMMMNGRIRETVLDLAKFQTELAASEYMFVTLTPSTIAFAALMNAVESIDDVLAKDLRFLISTVANVDGDSMLMHHTQLRLYEVITKQPGSPLTSTLLTAAAAAAASAAGNGKFSSSSNNSASGQRSVHVSPRAVAGPTH